ncbi:MAG: HAD family hydrolase [Candidatus Stahlbacteria bacterium]|nr:MAG: HAD family hydrolase [Candidatus Stahlbacteria bacterium]
MSAQGDFNFWLWLKSRINNITNFLAKWILPIGAVLLFVGIMVIPSFRVAEGKGVFLNNTLLGIITVVLTFLGSKIIATMHKGVSDQPIQTVLRDNTVHHFLKHVGRKDEVNIIIYTGYTIFSKWDELRLEYPNVEKAQIRMLVKDPDVEGQLRPEYIDMRWGQLNLALTKIEDYMKDANIEIRYYKNEPWFRGIEVGKKYLWLSHYTNRKEAMPDTTDIEYSSVDTPWIFINKTKSLKGIDTRNVDRFHSFFEMVWGHCTKYKNLILDLDGTLFQSDSLNRYFNEEVPKQFIREVSELSEEKVAFEFNQYEAMLSSEKISSTECLLRFVKERYDEEIQLQEYSGWKRRQDSALSDSLLPNANERLNTLLRKVSEVYRLILLTNHTSAFSKRVLEKLGISDLFGEDVITFDKTELIKPDPKILFYLMDELGLDLKLSIFVGDRPHVDLFQFFKSSLARVHVKGPEDLIEFLGDLKFPLKYLKRYSRKTRKYEIQSP